MIMGEQKPLDILLGMLAPYDKIVLAGCHGCVTVCRAGGAKEVEILASSLRLARETEGRPLEIKEVTRPQVNAQLVAENIAAQLVKRTNFRRAMKKAMEVSTEAGVIGIKIQVSGRLSGAEMARSESSGMGKVPLQTLDAHIQYGLAEAYTTYGAIGVKVWIYLGKYGEEVVTDGVNTQKA